MANYKTASVYELSDIASYWSRAADLLEIGDQEFNGDRDQQPLYPLLSAQGVIEVEDDEERQGEIEIALQSLFEWHPGENLKWEDPRIRVAAACVKAGEACFVIETLTFPTEANPEETEQRAITLKEWAQQSVETSDYLSGGPAAALTDPMQFPQRTGEPKPLPKNVDQPAPMFHVRSMLVDQRGPRMIAPYTERTPKGNEYYGMPEKIGAHTYSDGDVVEVLGHRPSSVFDCGDLANTMLVTELDRDRPAHIKIGVDDGYYDGVRPWPWAIEIVADGEGVDNVQTFRVVEQLLSQAGVAANFTRSRYARDKLVVLWENTATGERTQQSPPERDEGIWVRTVRKEVEWVDQLEPQTADDFHNALITLLGPLRTGSEEVNRGRVWTSRYLGIAYAVKRGAQNMIGPLGDPLAGNKEKLAEWWSTAPTVKERTRKRSQQYLAEAEQDLLEFAHRNGFEGDDAEELYAGFYDDPAARAAYWVQFLPPAASYAATGRSGRPASEVYGEFRDTFQSIVLGGGEVRTYQEPADRPGGLNPVKELVCEDSRGNVLMADYDYAIRGIAGRRDMRAATTTASNRFGNQPEQRGWRMAGVNEAIWVWGHRMMLLHRAEVIDRWDLFGLRNVDGEKPTSLYLRIMGDNRLTAMLEMLGPETFEYTADQTLITPATEDAEADIPWVNKVLFLLREIGIEPKTVKPREE